MFNSKEGEHLYKYYQDKENRLLENYHFLIEASEEEHFHQFRVSIKKTRVIFQLLELMSCDFNSTKYLNPLRSVFKPAGNIREEQINLKVISQYKQKESKEKHLYQQYCQTRITKGEKKFSEKLKEFDPALILKNGKEVKDCCRMLTQEEILGKTMVFIQDRLDTVRDNAANTSDEFMVHQIRTKLKEINAIINILRRIGIEGFNDELISLIRKIELDLGSWHDKVVLYNSIERFLRNQKPDNETRQFFKEVEQVIEAENQEFLLTLEGQVIHVIETIELTTKAVSNSL